MYQLAVGKDTRGASETFEAGLKLAPSHVEMIVALGRIEQARGNWERALSYIQRAAALDPRSVVAARRLAYTLLCLRRFPEAEAAQTRALGLAPSDPETIHQGAVLALAQGDRARAERIARKPPPGVNPIEQAYEFARYEELGWLLDETQQRSVLALKSDSFDDDRAAWALVRAQLYSIRGQSALARAYADSARIAYERGTRVAPDDAQQHALLGVALAFLGRKEEALRAAKRGTELVPIAEDGYFGPYVQLLLARVHMMVGNHDKAVESLRPALEVPNNVSRAWLRVDPTWDPLRRHRSFQKRVEGT
jgi:tetratricopeptide (TPR) repeat protein